MQHDITHCEGKHCRKREKCYRYKAYLEAIELKLPYIAVDTKPIVLKCNMFWEINK